MKNILRNCNKKKKIIIIFIILLIIVVISIFFGRNNIQKIIKNNFLKSQTEILSYEIYSNNIDENIQILAKVETEEGIKQIETPNGNIIYCNGKNVMYVDYNVKKDENYVFRTTKSNGEISEDTIRVTDDDIDKILNVKVDTEKEIATEGTLNITYNTAKQLTNKQYRIGTTGKFVTYKEPVKLDSYDILNKKIGLNDDKTLTIYVKALDSKGNGIEYEKKINCLDFEKASEPTTNINSKSEYALLTSKGIIVNSDVEIQFDKREDIYNYYSSDYGENWIKVEGNKLESTSFETPVLKMKSVKIASGLTTETQVLINPTANDAMQSLIFDKDDTTFQGISAGQKFYMQVDNSALKGKIRVKISGSGRGSSTSVNYVDENKSTIENITRVWEYASIGHPNADLETRVNENTKFIEVAGGSDSYARFYTINLIEPLKIYENLTAQEIAEHPDLYYGLNVTNYTSENGQSDWKIFYSDWKENPDNAHIFLITGDYVDPLDLNGSVDKEKINSNTEIIFGATKYMARWRQGGAPVFQNVEQTIKERFKSTIYDLNSNKEYANTRCISTLLNATNWEKYKDKSGKAEYAIGGATLEMWVESWNQRYPEDKLYCDNVNTVGYYIGTNNKPENIGVETLNKEGYSNKLYYPYKDYSKGTYGYWLAAPSASGNEHMYFVNMAGYVSSMYHFGYTSSNYPSDILGAIRPVVSLNKDITIDAKESGE